MKRYILSLVFKTGYRTAPPSETEESEDILTSETLHGAISYWLFNMFSDRAHNIAETLKVSSLFFRKDNEYLVPKPLILDTFDADNPKKVKKAGYVALSKLEKILKKGRIGTEDEDAFYSTGSILVHQRIPRNTLDRITNASMLYFVDVVRVRPEFTPVVLLETESEHARDVEAALRVLGEHGVGADSTYGFGLFDFKLDEAPQVFVKQSGDFYVTLGLFLPSPDEFSKLNDGFYRLRRKGGIHKDKMLRKLEINYIAEGSTFPFQLKGRGLLNEPDFVVQTSSLCLAI